MFETLHHLLYFLSHPSKYIGLWTLDLTGATLLFSVATLAVVLRQLRLMGQQNALMQRQTEIIAAQDALNRALLARRTILRLYAVQSSGRIDIYCVNDGNKTAQSFYWHFEVPHRIIGAAGVCDGTGNHVLSIIGTVSHDGVQTNHYSGLVSNPLYPTRTIHLAQFSTSDPTSPLWWRTVSEEGADPPEAEAQHVMERRESPGALAADL